jgi:hypothetical protein
VNAKVKQQAKRAAEKMWRKAKEFKDACADADSFAFAYIGYAASSRTKRARESAELASGLALDAQHEMLIALDAKQKKGVKK